MNFITVNVRNWEKYKGRGDVRQHSWFRLSNRVIEDPDLYHLDPAELSVWIYILCQCSQKGSSVVNLNIAHAERAARLSKKLILSALKKMEGFQIDPVDVTGAAVNVSAQDKTLQYKTVQDTIAHFDFDSLYKNYPKKVGKLKGLEILERTVKTQPQYDAFALALKNYVDYVERESIEAKFIKHFSTFTSQWKDWVDPETGTSSARREKTTEEVIRELEGDHGID